MGFFKAFTIGVAVATAAIVIFEIKFNYALGDKLKDFFLSEEAKLKALRAKVLAFAIKADNAALKLIKKGK